MDNLEYNICDFAEKCDNKTHDYDFLFENKKYKLRYKDLGPVLLYDLLRDIKKSQEFQLKETRKHYEPHKRYLSLFFKPGGTAAAMEAASYGRLYAKQRIIETFFNMETNLMDTTSDDKLPETSIKMLYDLLREAHSRNEQQLPPPIVCPKLLKPKLRSYQQKAVQWMMSRERQQETIPTLFVPVRPSDRDDCVFYYNPRSVELTPTLPADIVLPTGGILAEEMGLGKTVEMLALILSNKNTELKTVPQTDKNDKVKRDKEPILKCLCAKPVTKNVLKCSKCGFYQHFDCVAKNSVAKPNPLTYMCPECWKQNTVPIESATTFIVSPPSIKMQWYEEIKKHIAVAENFKVLIYNGIKRSGWICPSDLVTYDVVLTDYQTMQTELHYVESAKWTKVFRHKPRYINPMSPLTMIRWWRVCLDEAQLVEAPQNQCSKMVRELPAVHRWAVTGTPIEKSIEDLYGLLYFIDYQPYTDTVLWQNLVRPFQDGNPEPLVNAVSRVMWRTCKSNVLDEIGIPPQTERIHRITMSDLETFFYTSQHAQCAAQFHEKAIKLSNSLSMVNMNARTFKLLMDPLRKVRQDCTVPTILSRSDQSVKKILSPDELMQHLERNNEHDCKSELRTIVSSLNGLAALHILKKNYAIAEKKYKSVLRWAADASGSITVDKLLQVHALHNLIEISDFLGTDDQRTTYKIDLEKLEWNYMENCFVLIKGIKEQRIAAANVIEEINGEFDPSWTESWWAEYLRDMQARNQDTQLLEKIKLELMNSFLGKEELMNEVVSIYGIGLVILTWLDRLQKGRINLMKIFTKIEFFHNNIKPKSQLSAAEISEMDNFVKQAFKCHLDPDRYEEKRKTVPKKRSEMCLLCKAKDVLTKYEYTIFDKSVSNDREQGSWNPTFQETIIRSIYMLLKKDLGNADEALKKTGKAHLKLIDAFKEEFKVLSKLWVEINYTASAYDELNMCKSRLQAIDPNEMSDDDKRKLETKSKLYVSKYEIDMLMDELEGQRIEAEKQYLRLQGTLKYLKYLKKTNVTENCPICKQKPENKYSVMECGHHMCMECLVQMVAFYNTFLQCCVCRHKQKYEDVYYVTCKSIPTEDKDKIQINGDYSTKIKHIVLTILELKLNEPNVKIIIFSHWDAILGVIADALTDNGLEFRRRSIKFHESIHDFKNPNLNVTCMLLPLAYGSKGLNLIEATHVFLVEPILNPSEELQAIGRVHRIGQTKPTFVHRFIVQNSIEETIFNTISSDSTGKWKSKEVTVGNLQELFLLNGK